MVRVPLPVMSNSMKLPLVRFASCMAALRVQLPLPSSQTPSLVLLSAPSPVEFTVKVTPDNWSRDFTPARASARPCPNLLSWPGSPRSMAVSLIC